MKRLWVTGYRSYELNVFGQQDPKIKVIKYALKNYFISLLDDHNLDWIITGANLGVEQWAAEVGINLQAQYPVHVSVITPYQDFASRWNENNQANFLKIKEKVDFFAATSNNPYQSPGQLRNYQKFMLTHTDQALMLYDEEHPGKAKYAFNAIKQYREKHDYPLKLLDFYDLQDIAEEYAEKQEDSQF
jgi:uncharacterized phage-like protein YoqJ